PERLDQRDQPAAEEVGRDELHHLIGAELERTADDQRHRDGARVHHEHVLQAERRQARQRQSLVDGVNGGSGAAGGVGHARLLVGTEDPRERGIPGGSTMRRPNAPRRSRARRYFVGAPASNQRPITARSASVIWVALFSGMVFSATACWKIC